MNSARTSIASICLALFVAACSSGQSNSPSQTGGSGGNSGGAGGSQTGGSGGDKGTGGAAGAGGAQGTGGMQDKGGAPGGGGKQGTGGAESTGGKLGTGGTRATGGAQGGGGSEGTGGASAGDAGRDVPAKDDVSPADAAAPKDGQGSASDGSRVEAQGGEVITVRQINTRGFTFDVLETGSAGEPVLLLHGFPDTSLEWSGLMPVLSANGYHCLAPDQRGYSPGARPTEVDAYRYEELVADAFAIGRELGDRFHVIGHDWGAIVGWLMLQKDPSPIASFTAISIPHYAVWARSVYDDKDMASYLSMLNTWMTEGKGEAFWTADQMRRMWTAKPADQTEKTIAHMTEPGAMTAALNWYRASRGHKRVIEEFNIWEVNVPTLLIWGSKDLGLRSVTDTAALMTGSYRVVKPDGAHFIVDEQPKAVADETLAHLRAYPIM
jgi:pimeloyl-ACP methyl ester carboxylesterase